MITVHHLNNSRSHRILWLLEELDLPYEIKLYYRDKNLQAPPELKAIHPLGKAPILEDGNKLLVESGAIIEYIVNKYGQGKLKPSDEDSSLRYTFWLHYAEGSLMSPLLLTLVFHKIETFPMPFFAKPIVRGMVTTIRKILIGPELKKNFDYIESELAKSEWFAGNSFSAADIQMSFPVECGESVEQLKDRPKLKSFLSKIHARPAYKKALERGGPFEIPS